MEIIFSFRVTNYPKDSGNPSSPRSDFNYLFFVVRDPGIECPAMNIDYHSFTLHRTTTTNDEFIKNDSNEMKMNLNYKHKDKIQKENNNESKEISHFLLEDRKYQIDASIIHNLKLYQKLDFNELKKYVTQSLSNYFAPEDNIIKARLDNLIDRNFIERDKDNNDIYIYIP